MLIYYIRCTPLECQLHTEHKLAAVGIVELNQVDVGLRVVTGELGSGEEVASHEEHLGILYALGCLLDSGVQDEEVT